MTRIERDHAVSRWECPSCGVEAHKHSTRWGNRWLIDHTDRCTEFRGREDVGPVTSVNDPDNAYFIVDE